MSTPAIPANGGNVGTAAFTTTQVEEAAKVLADLNTTLQTLAAAPAPGAPAPAANPQDAINAALNDAWQQMGAVFQSQFPPVTAFPDLPTIEGAVHPKGSLTTGPEGVTTPGGYKIIPNSKYEWTIEAPDGQTTRIWGDPHVEERDGGKWDFKRDTTFVLADGTRINVNTKDYGNGFTVTAGLEIRCGDEKVVISDVDKGRGKIGKVEASGHDSFRAAGKDVVTQGQDGDDWTFQGREIVGSEEAGAVFKLGDQMGMGQLDMRMVLKAIQDSANQLAAHGGGPTHQGPVNFYLPNQPGQYQPLPHVENIQANMDAVLAAMKAAQDFTALNTPPPRGPIAG